MKEISIVIKCIKPVDSHDVSYAPGDKGHLGIMLFLGVYACYAC